MPNSDDSFVYTVSELNQDVRMLLERGFSQLWLEGEISNFACPSSGHWYFSLKDARAQVRCAMFKNKNRSTGFTPKQGDQVVVKARISLYEARGEYQILVDEMEEAGSGVLQRAFENLKKKLQTEGLFETTVKKPLPKLPQQIGVITSPTGAAVKDIISVLQRRFPAIPLLIFPVAVQGEQSAQQIVDAIKIMDKSDNCDVLILARGGGSLEDLWSFNEEIVAHAIFHCNTPIITGIGHEIDFTIADLVADVRAATPSAAAEIVAPDKDELLESLLHFQKHLSRLMMSKLSDQSKQLDSFSQRLKHPSRRVTEFTQQIDELELRLNIALKHRLKYKQNDLINITARLSYHNPMHQLQQLKQDLSRIQDSMQSRFLGLLENKQQQLETLANSLNLVSPLATLNRGYAIVSGKSHIVRSIDDVNPQEKIEVRVADGQINCTVNHSLKSK